MNLTQTFFLTLSIQLMLATHLCIREKDFLLGPGKDMKFVSEMQEEGKEKIYTVASNMWKCRILGKPIVAKVYDRSKPGHTAKAMREVKTMQRMRNNPNFIKLGCCVISDNTITLYIENHGKDLLDELNEFHALEWKKRLTLIYELSQAILDLHQAKRFHGDIKLENIVIDRKLTILKLIDFGGSVHFGNPEIEESTAYAAPERLERGVAQVATAKKDVWSLVLVIGFLINPTLFDRFDKKYFSNFPADSPSKSSFIPDETFVEDFQREIVRGLKGDQRLVAANIGKWLALNPDERPSVDRIVSFLRQSISNK